MITACSFNRELRVRQEGGRIHFQSVDDEGQVQCMEVLSIYRLGKTDDLADAARVWWIYKEPSAKCASEVVFPHIPSGYHLREKSVGISPGHRYRAIALAGATEAREDFVAIASGDSAPTK